MDIEKISAARNKANLKTTIKAAVKIVKRICELYPKILEVQPKITGIHTGMGSWSFNGKGIAFSNEDENKGEEIEIDGVAIEDNIIEDNRSWYDFPANHELREIVQLVNYLICSNEGLNCSTWQNGFNEKGVVFYHSETSDQNNPFSVPNKAYLMNDDYYRAIVKANVPVVFIHDKN